MAQQNYNGSDVQTQMNPNATTFTTKTGSDQRMANIDVQLVPETVASLTDINDDKAVSIKRSNGNIVCYNCHTTGHIARHCKEPKHVSSVPIQPTRANGLLTSPQTVNVFAKISIGKFTADVLFIVVVTCQLCPIT